MRTIISTLVFILLSSLAFSQIQIGLGIKGGANISSLNVKYQYTDANEGKDYTGKLGYQGGIFAMFKLKKIAIQPEILYAQQGTKFEFQYQNTEDWKADFTYIAVPVLVKYYAFEMPIGSVNVLAGPQLSFLQKAEMNFTDIDGDGAQNRNNTNVKDIFNPSDLVVVLGVGLDLPFGLTVDLRYNLGVKNMYDRDYNYFNEYELKNRSLQLSVGYKILKFGK